MQSGKKKYAQITCPVSYVKTSHFCTKIGQLIVINQKYTNNYKMSTSSSKSDILTAENIATDAANAIKSL